MEETTMASGTQKSLWWLFKPYVLGAQLLESISFSRAGEDIWDMTSHILHTKAEATSWMLAVVCLYQNSCWGLLCRTTGWVMAGALRGNWVVGAFTLMKGFKQFHENGPVLRKRVNHVPLSVHPYLLAFLPCMKQQEALTRSQQVPVPSQPPEIWGKHISFLYTQSQGLCESNRKWTKMIFY